MHKHMNIGILTALGVALISVAGAAHADEAKRPEASSSAAFQKFIKSSSMERY